MNAPDQSVACEDRDFVEWHGGCRHALVWAVEADVDEVRAAVSSARGHWGDVLLPRHERQPHITLAYAGPVALPGTRPVDEPYSRAKLADDLARLRGLAQRPFEVAVGGWGTFPMVPYLRASAPALAAANSALMAGSPYAGGYVPHVTVGHYSVSRPLAEMAARAAAWGPWDVILEVGEWALMAYETHDIAGPLTTVGRLSLAAGRWSVEARIPGLDL
ncbi:2'-5' RNA ligase family protein [Tessaracoccus sp. G1721]